MSENSRSTRSDLFIRESAVFERIKKQGRRYRTSLFMMVSRPTPDSRTRVGVVVGRRLGKAVMRNRAKRRFRELVRSSQHLMDPGHECLVYPRREAVDISYTDLRARWLAALRHEGLLVSDSNRQWTESSST